jgi:MASE1
MDETKWRYLEKGVALSAVYCAAYLAAWFHSLDQWLLPVGLRITGLLLLPYRFWPFLLVGDAAALLVLRVPRASFDGALWAYASCFLQPFMTAVVPYIVREKAQSLAQVAKWFPLILAIAAYWSVVCNYLVNTFFGGPTDFSIFRVFVGSFLGATLISLPFLIWLFRAEEKGLKTTNLLRDGIFTAMLIATLYVAANHWSGLSKDLRLTFLVLMFSPTIFLTLHHGWRGALIGAWASNLGVGVVLLRFNFESAHDTTVFIGQQILLLSTAALLAFGWKVSEHYERAREAGISERQARALAQGSFFSGEDELRRHMLFMAHMQLLYDDEYKYMADWLRANGYAKAALDLNTRAVEHRRIFDQNAQALYPIQIEEHGLFSVVYSPPFRRFWAGDAEVLIGFAGQLQGLSIELQLAVYRCICHAMTILGDCDPSEYGISMRVWNSSRRRGIAVSVRVVPTGPFRMSPSAMAAADQLSARVKAYGGILRRHTHKIRFWLSEPSDGAAHPPTV